MNLHLLYAPLEAEDIDFRIGHVNNGGYATILAYKDARVDMKRLDLAVGPLNWKREHARDNHNCIVSIWDADKAQWVSKEDVGTESNTEAEKGLASDSFKRACFNWGIGRCLYDFPVISIQLKPDEKDDKGKLKAWKLNLKEWKWAIEYNDEGKCTALAAKDSNGQIRYRYGEFKKERKQ